MERGEREDREREDREREREMTGHITEGEREKREKSACKLRYLIWLLISRVLKSLPTIFTIYC